MSLNLFESAVFMFCAVVTTFNVSAIAQNLAVISNQLHRNFPQVANVALKNLK